MFEHLAINHFKINNASLEISVKFYNSHIGEILKLLKEKLVSCPRKQTNQPKCKKSRKKPTA